MKIQSTESIFPYDINDPGDDQPISPSHRWIWVGPDLEWAWGSHSAAWADPSYFILDDHQLQPVSTPIGASFEQHRATFARVRLFYRLTPRVLAFFEQKAEETRLMLPSRSGAFQEDFRQSLETLRWLQRFAFVHFAAHFGTDARRKARQSPQELPEPPFPSVADFRRFDWYTRDIDAWRVQNTPPPATLEEIPDPV